MLEGRNLSVGTTLLDTWCNSWGQSCARAMAGLSGPCESLPTWDIL